MFDFNNTKISNALDERISELLTKLKGTTETEEYTKLTNNLAKLMDLRNNALKTQNEKTKVENEEAKIKADNVINQAKNLLEEQKLNLEAEKIKLESSKFGLEEAKFEDAQEARRSWKPSPDAVVGAAASVAGILLVLNYEKIGVITSKALGFVGRMTK
jgi:hypothetical protein